MFAYCGNNPISYKDISGQFYVLAAAAIGGVIGAATGALSALVAGGDGIEILTAAIAGMGAGAISVVSPFAALLITFYAALEIDVHAQRRTSPGEDINYGRAVAKGIAAGATGWLTGTFVSGFDVIPSNLLTEQFGTGFSMLTYFFDLVNVAIILPIHDAIDRHYNPDKPNQRPAGSGFSAINKMPPSAPPNALNV